MLLFVKTWQLFLNIAIPCYSTPLLHSSSYQVVKATGVLEATHVENEKKMKVYSLPKSVYKTELSPNCTCPTQEKLK
jgi:hypothetical protein